MRTGRVGRLMAVAQQKRMAFKEHVTFYRDDQRTEPVFSFQARQALDLGAGYDVRDAAGVTARVASARTSGRACCVPPSTSSVARPRGDRAGAQPGGRDPRAASSTSRSPSTSTCVEPCDRAGGDDLGPRDDAARPLHRDASRTTGWTSGSLRPMAVALDALLDPDSLCAMRVHLGSDHAGLELKDHLLDWLRDHGHEPVDHGPFVYDAHDDYPVFCLRAAEGVAADDGQPRCRRRRLRQRRADRGQQGRGRPGRARVERGDRRAGPRAQRRQRDLGRRPDALRWRR